MIKGVLQKPDVLGAAVSVLCVVHCLATPLIFIAHTCAIGSCKSTPGWWGSLDYVFITMSFFAIKRSVKNSSNKNIKIALWFSWCVLFLLIVNETVVLFFLPEILTYINALFLAVLHVYNMKYCQCKNDACCNNYHG